MNKTKRHLGVLVLVIALLAIPTVGVFAKELGSLTISGPGIDGEMTLDQQGAMMKLEQTGFFDQNLSIKPPGDLGAGYNITANLNLDGKVVPFIQLVYYASDGIQPGYVHYTARLSGESLQPVDQWRRLHKDADTALRGLMDEYNIALQPAFVAAAEAAPAVKPAVEDQTVVKEPVAEPEVNQSDVVDPVAAAPAETPTASAVSNQLVLALVASFFVLLGAGLMIRRRAQSQASSQA